MKNIPPGALRAGLSRFGLGCGTFGREIEQAESFAMMDHAWANQITHFDTAEAYGRPAGRSELIIGEWIRGRRPDLDRMVLATKMLAPYTAENVEQKVTQSLKRLGLDSVDAVYFHGWHESAADPGVLAALDRLVRAGWVRALGASNFDAARLKRVLKLQKDNGWARLRLLQNNNNYAVSDVDDELAGLCAREDVAIVTYSPLGAGFLTGKHRQSVEPGSRFDIVPDHQDIYFHDPSWKRLADLEALAGRTGRPMAQLAIAWATSRPGISSVLIGGRKTAHLDQALASRTIDAATVFSVAG